MKNIALVMVVGIIVGLAASIAAQGFDPSRQYKIYGYGTNSCGKFTAWRRSRDDNGEIAVTWITGFVTGAGMHQPLRQSDTFAITAWVENYCQQNPLDNLSGATSALVVELTKN